MKRHYSSSLKIFNYIEAALPILISEDMGHQRWYLEHYGMALKMRKKDFYDLDEHIEKNTYHDLLSNLMKKRESLFLDNQIGRVVKFYNKILDVSILE